MKIIVVDDQLNVLLVLQLMLKRLGHEVVACSCGAQTLECIATAEADVVLCDLTMPDMDGYSVALGIRAHETIRQPKLLAISALPADRRHAEVTAAGFDGYLEKPLRLV